MSVRAFSAWLLRQVARQDAVGDLARDARADETWPSQVLDLDAIHDSLDETNASQEAHEALDRAWFEFEHRSRGDLISV